MQYYVLHPAFEAHGYKANPDMEAELSLTGSSIACLNLVEKDTM